MTAASQECPNQEQNRTKHHEDYMLDSVQDKQVFKLNAGFVVFVALKTDVLDMIFTLPVFNQPNEHCQVDYLEGPLDRGSNRAKMIVTHFAQDKIANNWVNGIPAEQTTTLAFHLARKANISDEIVIENVKHSEYTSDD